ncbi:hypothetical protein GCM10018784_40730 [Streptomyces hydrogenans]|nr:hypothetical protein GCM10018784_40730 [Streptomyces hydrogenans]
MRRTGRRGAGGPGRTDPGARGRAAVAGEARAREEPPGARRAGGAGADGKAGGFGPDRRGAVLPRLVDPAGEGTG